MQRVHFALAAFVGLLAWYLAILFRNFEVLRTTFIYGDWMINYSGGLVRRGLGGEIILWASGVLAIEPVDAAFYLVAGLLIAFLGMVAWLIVGKATTFETAILFSSPGLLFAAQNLEAGRKDILVCLLMAISLLIVRIARDAKNLIWAGALFVVLATVFAFVHESALFFAPAFGAPIALSLAVRGARISSMVFSAALVAALVSAFILVASWGALDAEGVARVCGRLGSSAPTHCTGPNSAIGWLVHDPAYGIRIALGYLLPVRLTNLAWGFVGGVILVAMVLSRHRLAPSARPALPRMLQAPWVHIVAFGVATIPLYVLGVDWGRWFSLWFVLSILYLVGMRSSGMLVREESPADRSPWRSTALPAALVFMSLLWPFPVTGTESGATVLGELQGMFAK